MSTDAVQIVERIQSVLVGTDVVAALDDEEADRVVRSMLDELAEPDFEVAMIGPDYLPARREATGPDGFGDVWREWTSPFEHFRIELDDVIDAGEVVVSLVRQVGYTKTGGVEIASSGAAVWTIRSGKVKRVEFHLDQAAALRVAGIPPGSS